MSALAFWFSSALSLCCRIAVYKVLDKDGTGTMSDTVAAINQAVKDGVHVISLSLGFSAPVGTHTLPNIFEMTILGAVKAGVHVVHAARNAGSKPSSIVSYGPWLTSVGATTMDRSYSAYLYTNDGRGSHVNISNPYQDSHPLSVNFGVCVDVFCRAGDEKFRRDLLQLVRLA